MATKTIASRWKKNVATTTGAVMMAADVLTGGRSASGRCGGRSLHVTGIG
jgi:hypothetical protein